ncbi:hypothetical protein [Nocardioides nanhaiensis]|uniref:ATP-dependent sacrificial sulfur transferase LarE n=1 Tax=Nocardioides nanhaiensis TaxID=1476871 RepID=A0ABP8WC09_9ACTN
MSTHPAQAALTATLSAHPRRVVACSGGVDSLLLAAVAHEAAPATTVVAHSVTPAVPEAATERVRRTAGELGWHLVLVDSPEFDDERYLANPVDRCFFCKTNLYDELERIVADLPQAHAGWTLLSGANTDDLGEYRPGLLAAAEHAVRHPYVEAGLGKADIRALAGDRGHAWHQLPAAPCLASRLYTGTPVTPGLVRAVEAGEAMATRLTGEQVLRTRVRDDVVLLELPAATRHRVDERVLGAVLTVMRRHAPHLRRTELDPEPYAPGRSFVGAPQPVSLGLPLTRVGG